MLLLHEGGSTGSGGLPAKLEVAKTFVEAKHVKDVVRVSGTQLSLVDESASNEGRSMLEVLSLVLQVLMSLCVCLFVLKLLCQEFLELWRSRLLFLLVCLQLHEVDFECAIHAMEALLGDFDGFFDLLELLLVLELQDGFLLVTVSLLQGYELCVFESLGLKWLSLRYFDGKRYVYLVLIPINAELLVKEIDLEVSFVLQCTLRRERCSFSL